MDSSTWPTYSTPDPELEAILAHIPPIPSFASAPSAPALRASIASQMSAMAQAGILVPVDWTSCCVSQLSIPVAPGRSVRAVKYSRSQDGKAAGLVVYFHGGGWTFGAPEFGEKYFEPIVKELGVCVVSVAYGLAPEEKWPVAVGDAGGAVEWCAANAEALNVDLAKGFVVMGTSAGGNLAAVAAHEVVDKGVKPALTGVVLMAPNLLHFKAVPEEWREHYRSFEEHKDALILDRKGIEFFDEQYQADPKSPLASPLLWKSHEGQPRTYLQIMGADPLRDEALIYEHVLKEAGVEVKVDIFAGIPHGGPDFFPMHSVAKKAVDGAVKALEWMLEAGK